MRTLSVAAILAALSLPAYSADLSPSALRALLTGEDAQTAVQSLDEQSWMAFLGHVEAGHRGWMDVVPHLAPDTSAAMSSGLVLALSRALQSNAPGVLSVMAESNYDPGDICGAVDMDLSTFEAVRFIDQALVKVAAVIDPALTDARNDCLFSLGRARISTLI